MKSHSLDVFGGTKNARTATEVVSGPTCCPRPGCHSYKVRKTECDFHDYFTCLECGQGWMVAWKVCMDMQITGLTHERY